MTGDAEQILTTVDGGVGFLTLNRPGAINSLTQTMVDTMRTVLADWEHDDAIHTVVLTGAGERGLCAGGDVVAIYHSARADGAAARQFWHDEYLLNAAIGRFGKPGKNFVAVMDGIVMGGGVGVGAHADTRVVTDTTKMAMPEVGIGFIPDVGGSYLLSRAPGGLGLHAALTGAPFSGADAIALGFADHYLPRDRLGDFTAAVVTDGTAAAVAAHVVQPPPSTLAEHRDWIDQCYSGATVAEIIDALNDHGRPEASEAAQLICTRSPIALSVTLESVRRATRLATLEDALSQEYRVSCASLRSHDLVEGIRAQLVDKDRNPRWSPATLAEVSRADVDAYFLPAEPDLSFEEKR